MTGALIRAAFDGDMKEMTRILNNGARADGKNNEALIIACTRGNVDAVKLLHQRGADIQARGFECLVRAASTPSLDLVKYLVDDLRAPVRTQKDGPLVAAVANDRRQIVEYLLKNGGDPNARDGLPLATACALHLNSVAKALVQRGGVPTESVVILGVKENDADLVGQALQGGVSGAALRGTGIVAAVQMGFHTIGDMLIDNVVTTDAWGDPEFLDNIRNLHSVDILTRFLKHDKVSRESVIRSLEWAVSKEDPELVRAILANVNDKIRYDVARQVVFSKNDNVLRGVTVNGVREVLYQYLMMSIATRAFASDNMTDVIAAAAVFGSRQTSPEQVLTTVKNAIGPTLSNRDNIREMLTKLRDRKVAEAAAGHPAPSPAQPPSHAVNMQAPSPIVSPTPVPNDLTPTVTPESSGGPPSPMSWEPSSPADVNRPQRAGPLPSAAMIREMVASTSGSGPDWQAPTSRDRAPTPEPLGADHPHRRAWRFHPYDQSGAGRPGRSRPGGYSSFYKTRPCRYGFGKPELCPFNDKCIFAHSERELRQLSAWPSRSEDHRGGEQGGDHGSWSSSSQDRSRGRWRERSPSRTTSYDQSSESRTSSYDRPSESRASSYDWSSESRTSSYDRSSESRTSSYDWSSEPRMSSPGRRDEREYVSHRYSRHGDSSDESGYAGGHRHTWRDSPSRYSTPRGHNRR